MQSNKYNYLKQFLPPHIPYDGTNRNWFYSIPNEEIFDAEKKLNIIFPPELKEFYKEIGYGSLYAPHNALKGFTTYISNQILSPNTIVDILTLGHESEYIADSVYDSLSLGDLPFFEMYDGSHFLIMKLNSDNPNAVWTISGIKIEDSFEKFIWRLYYQDPAYYGQIIEDYYAKQEK